MTPALREHIRARLAARTRRVSGAPGTRAAVLILIYERGGEPHVLFTERTHRVEHHKGQISFPGGAMDEGDADLAATALRETWEEVGIAPEGIEILGAFDDADVVTGFVVTPFVGWLEGPVTVRHNTDEIERIIEVPLSYLLDLGRYRVEPRERQGRVYQTTYLDYGPHTIWGATGGILRRFVEEVFGGLAGPAAHETL